MQFCNCNFLLYLFYLFPFYCCPFSLTPLHVKVSGVNVSRSLPAGTWITKVEAVEQTSSRHRITYTIFSGNENHDFSINRHTGKKHA